MSVLSLHRAALVAGVAVSLVATIAIAGTNEPIADGSYLKPYRNLWKMQITRGGAPAGSGTWSDLVSTVTVDGRTAMRRVQVVTLPKGGSLTYVNVFDPKTLRPISNAMVVSNGDYTAHRFSEDGREIVTFDAKGERRALPQERKSTLAERIYDYNGGMYGLILRGFPLEAGLKGTLKTLDTNSNAVVEVPFRVLGRETIEAKPGTSVQTWVVEADFVTADKSEEGSVFRFYLADEAPFVIKLVFDNPKDQVVQTFTMIDPPA